MRVYMDNVSSAPVDKRVIEAMFPYFDTRVGNPASLHSSGIEAEITNRTIIISCQYANSEIGTIQPIAEIGAMTREQDVIFHVDAVAAAGKIHIDVQQDNIDLLSISSNDMYGTRGAGALYVRSGILLRPVMTGGGQERGLRSGSENIPAIVGMGKACEITKEEIKSDARRMESLRERLIEGVLGNIRHAYLTGHRTRRLPHIASYRFSFIEGESIILSLNDLGIEATTGSACSVKTLEPSHVLIAIGLRHEEAHGSLLLSLNRWNTEEEVDYVLESLPLVVDRLRALSPLYNGD